MAKLSRRHFLMLCAATNAGLLLPTGSARAEGVGDFPLHKKIGEGLTICPYCSCGCGLVIATDESGHITNAEGDPDHIVNRGALDPKSISVPQLSNSPLRLKNVMYRAPNSDQWEAKSWEWATATIAERIKKTRDESFVTTLKVDGKDVTVNRAEGLGWIGGAANNTEDCYLSVKLARALGGVYIEHQARI